MARKYIGWFTFMFVRLYCGVHRAVGIRLGRLSDALGKRDGTAEIPFVSFSSWEGMGEQQLGRDGRTAHHSVLRHAQLMGRSHFRG